MRVYKIWLFNGTVRFINARSVISALKQNGIKLSELKDWE